MLKEETVNKLKQSGIYDEIYYSKDYGFQFGAWCANFANHIIKAGRNVFHTELEKYIKNFVIVVSPLMADGILANSSGTGRITNNMGYVHSAGLHKICDYVMHLSAGEVLIPIYVSVDDNLKGSLVSMIFNKEDLSKPVIVEQYVER